MKKNRIYSLASLMLALAVFSSCGDDDKGRKNTLVFNGEKFSIQWAGIDTGDLEEGNYEIGFLPESDLTNDSPWDEDHYFMIQLGSEWDGNEVDLTEVDDEFDWSWYVEYWNDGDTETEDDDIYLWGFGAAEEEFNDVTGGNLTITALDVDEFEFEVEFEVEFEGNTYKGYYKGTLETYGSSSPARRLGKN